jgi:uncharacterized protein YecE (DUF72 family)
LTIYLGTQGWSYKDWVGSFYPAGTAARDFLACYAQQFGAVELDTTFYGTPTPSRVRTWFDVTPDDFLFTAKVPRSITHDRHLVDCREDFEEFVAIMRLLGHKLGPILIQLPPDFTAGSGRPWKPFSACSLPSTASRPSFATAPGSPKRPMNCSTNTASPGP